MKNILQKLCRKQTDCSCDAPKKSSIPWAQFGPVGLLVFIWILLNFISPHFGNKFNQMNLLRHAAVLMVATAAQTFTVIVGGLNIAIGASATLAAVVSAAVAVEMGTAAGFVAGVASGVLTGLILGIAFGYFNVNPVIGSIGLMAIARGLSFEITQGRPITGMPKDYAIIGMRNWGSIPILFIVALVTIIIIHLFLTYTIWGRNIFAVGVDEEAARLAGVNVRIYKTLSQVLSVAVAAWAGVMLGSRVNSGIPTLASTMHLETIAAIILGGTLLFSGEGNVLKSTVGVFILTMLFNGMDLAHISPYFRDILLGLIVITVVFVNVRFKPKSSEI